MSLVPDFAIRSKRLILRPWRESDLAPFASLTADPRVMEYFPKLLTREESDTTAKRLSSNIHQHGYGLWAVEVPDVADFIGFVGVQSPSFQTPYAPCVEIGWRIAFEHWGHGYATEAAAAALDDAFTRLSFFEILAFTVPQNQRSRRVMEKLGMTHSLADAFDHPNYADNERLRRLIVYRILRTNWKPVS